MVRGYIITSLHKIHEVIEESQNSYIVMEKHPSENTSYEVLNVNYSNKWRNCLDT